MRKWLLWRPNSENLKIQLFGSGRSVGQNYHYFRSYMTQETSIILYELPLSLCFINEENGKMVVL